MDKEKWSLWLLWCAALAAGCGDGSADPPSALPTLGVEADTDPRPLFDPAGVASRVSGKILFEGTAPERVPVRMLGSQSDPSEKVVAVRAMSG